MRKLLKYFKGYRLQAVCAPLFKIIEVIFELMVPLVVAEIVDTGIPAGDKPYIYRMCGILVLFGACGLASTLTAQYFSAKASAGFTGAVRQALFDHIQSLSFTEIDKLGTSTLITRLTSDLNQIQTGVNLTLRLLMRSPVVVIGATVMAFRIDAQAALIFVAVIPILSVVVFGIMLGTIPLYTAVQKKLDAVLLRTKENLTGARVVRAFCMEEEETADFNEKNNSLAKAQKFVGRISSVMNPMTYAIVNIGIVVLIYTGAVKVSTGVLTQGLVIALYNYMSQILVELVKLANLIISVTKSLACARRVEEVFEIQPSMESGSYRGEKSSESEYAVELSDVSFRYSGAAADSLENINIRVKNGEKIGIIGSTGSGKTTLVSLVPRFYDATEGYVKVGGVDVRDWNEEALRDNVAVVMQRSSLFSGTIRDNIKFGNENATDSEIMEAIGEAQAENVVEAKPEGLDSMIEQGGKNLSGGQIQRLTIARALVKKPKVLILDDSSSALDFATDAALRKSISNLDYHPTVLTVSQRVSTVMHSDRVLMLEDGVAVGLGTHEELLENCSEYLELYQSQIKNS
ncbi:MAG: ABC transporter ATP-binding protein/permease [Oscillospiraceae bacterium]|nr:ABC transporter ATP-binding protein/permease [Oscillospiraceae bacterium]